MIIGFCGYARSGKDTAAQPLIEKGFTRVAFADELKKRAAVALSTSVKEVEARKKELRPLLVELGRAGRLLDPDYWIRSAFYDRFDNEDLVITDVRYLNEVKAIYARGGDVVFVERPKFTAANEEEAASINDIMRHSYLPVIHNCGSIEELHQQVLERYA